MSDTDPRIEITAILDRVTNTYNQIQGRVTHRLEPFGRGPIVFQTAVDPIDCEKWHVSDTFLGSELLNKIVKGICTAVSGLLVGVGDTLNTIIDAITGTINGLITGIGNTVDAIFGSLGSKISELIDSILDKMEEIATRIVVIIDQVTTALSKAVVDISNALATAINNVLNSVSDGFTEIANTLKDLVSSITDNVVKVVDAIGDNIVLVIDTLVSSAERIFLSIEQGFTRLIDQVIGGVESGLGAVEKVIESVPIAIKSSAAGLTSGIAEGVGGPLKTLGTLMFDQIEAAMDKLIEDKDLDVTTTLEDIMKRMGVPVEAVAKATKIVAGVTPRAQGITLMVLAGVLITILPQVISAVTSPLLEALNQEVRGVVRQALIPVPDSLEAYYRDELTRDELDKELHQAGLQTNKIDILINTGRRFASPQDLRQWWLRGLISESEHDEALIGQRVRPQDLDNIKEASFFIPGAQDLIRFAVREVFSPSIRRDFGLDDDFPQEFADNAKKVGLSDEWARAFWAAHWVLPSIRMGFEMFHRRFIEQSDVELLMRTQDVMPFWRDNILKIAYRPITRVDVRRFHKLGLVDEEELQLRYQDVGYSPDDAARMVEFTIAFNAGDEPEEVAPITTQTRTMTTDLLEDGAIRESDARSILRALDYSEPLADLIVDQTLLEIERKDRKVQADAITNKAKSGGITFEQAQGDLAALGFETDELQKILTTLQRDLDSKNKLPSLSMLTTMRERKVIKDDIFIATLGRLGYSPEWAERILENEKKG